MSWLVNSWYQQTPLKWLLLPLTILYQGIVTLRKIAYEKDWFTRHKLPVPVIIVGNISVGGTGKTPFVIWLVDTLKQAGYHPGVVSRGYGGKSRHYPVDVKADSPPSIVGDEPLLIASRAECPVVVDPNRSRAAIHLISEFHCDVVISDDGLQHYALQRDIEIVLVDNQRRFGNKLCLPAGPLRESISRLNEVDFIIYHGEADHAQYQMQLEADNCINLANQQSKPLFHFAHQEVHAVAAIGNPQRFFDQLTQNSLIVHPHAFSDHHQLKANELKFGEDMPILMTEKDAVKCNHLAKANMWYLPVSAKITPQLSADIINQLKRCLHG